MEKLVESLAGKTEVLGKNLPQCRFVHHKIPHSCRRGGKQETNRLSYGAASHGGLVIYVYYLVAFYSPYLIVKAVHVVISVAAFSLVIYFNIVR
jgi:hypothetical protein